MLNCLANSLMLVRGSASTLISKAPLRLLDPGDSLRSEVDSTPPCSYRIMLRFCRAMSQSELMQQDYPKIMLFQHVAQSTNMSYNTCNCTSEVKAACLFLQGPSGVTKVPKR